MGVKVTLVSCRDAGAVGFTGEVHLTRLLLTEGVASSVAIRALLTNGTAASWSLESVLVKTRLAVRVGGVLLLRLLDEDGAEEEWVGAHAADCVLAGTAICVGAITLFSEILRMKEVRETGIMAGSSLDNVPSSGWASAARDCMFNEPVVLRNPKLAELTGVDVSNCTGSLVLIAIPLFDCPAGDIVLCAGELDAATAAMLADGSITAEDWLELSFLRLPAAET